MATLQTLPIPTTHTAILGVGDYRPRRVVPNEEIIGPINSSDEWIREKSGVVTRHRAGEGESVIDMGVAAGRAALDHAGISAEQIDVVLVATITHLLQTPAAATMIGERLGTGHAAAMDLSAACAGYCYGIGVADALIRSGQAKHVLVIGVERLLDLIDPTDRGAAFIFGDGAGAAVVGPSDTPGIGPTVWGADGSGADLIAQDRDWTLAHGSWRGRGESPDAADLEIAEEKWPSITMQGPSVFRWAVYQMAPVARAAMDAAGVGVDDLDVFIPHQANVRIIDALAKQLHLPDRVVIANEDIADMANTSAATIPLATTRLLREGKAKRGDLALQIGYGAGLAWAAQVVVLP